jgi:hypothetical protein
MKAGLLIPLSRQQLRPLSLIKPRTPHYATICNVKHKAPSTYRTLSTEAAVAPFVYNKLPVFDFFHSTKEPSFIFAHGATGFAKKPMRYTTPSMNNDYYSVQIGEDAYFRRSDALGVADGVGGWADVSGFYLIQRKSPITLLTLL